MTGSATSREQRAPPQPRIRGRSAYASASVAVAVAVRPCRPACPERSALPEDFRFYDLRHTGHTLTTRSGATLKDTMVRAGQSSEKAALFYQHSNLDRQKEVAGGLDAMVRAARQKPEAGPDQVRSGT
ncbi:hypothetical protein SAMN05428945_1944 [Streptomyces sp. 2224.1]|nr:hypothetical protein SAMN05428945_1944 [Streptomyces sp. 2224.1]